MFGMSTMIDEKIILDTSKLEEDDLKVGVSIDSYIGYDAFATHVFASFHYKDNVIDVGRIATENIYNKWDIGQDVREVRIDVAIGQHTTRFNSIYELIEAIESEFSRLFGEPCIIYGYYNNLSWEEYKKERIEYYD
jgi:hypothetical protein